MLNVKIPYWLIIKRYWVSLTGISIAWFVYDFITYPVSCDTLGLFGLCEMTDFAQWTLKSDALAFSGEGNIRCIRETVSAKLYLCGIFGARFPLWII